MLVCTHKCLSGVIWSYLDLSGCIWSYLALPEAIWSYLERSHSHIALNSVLSSYAVLYDAYDTMLAYLLMEFIPYPRLHPRVHIWRHLELSGAI